MLRDSRGMEMKGSRSRGPNPREAQIAGVLIIVILAALNFTSATEAPAEEKPALAIVPFLTEEVEDPARGAICPVCKAVYLKGEIPPGARTALTRLLYQKVEALGTFQVLPVEKVEEALSPSLKRELTEKPTATAVQLGRELKASFVLVGFLFRFDERVGSSLGVEKPASVGFDLHLLRTKDGKRVWDKDFNETQKPLTDDLLKIGSFFRRKAHWLTAEELAGVGMEETLKKLPGTMELEEGS